MNVEQGWNAGLPHCARPWFIALSEQFGHCLLNTALCKLFTKTDEVSHVWPLWETSLMSTNRKKENETLLVLPKCEHHRCACRYTKLFIFPMGACRLCGLTFILYIISIQSLVANISSLCSLVVVSWVNLCLMVVNEWLRVLWAMWRRQDQISNRDGCCDALEHITDARQNEMLWGKREGKKKKGTRK